MSSRRMQNLAHCSSMRRAGEYPSTCVAWVCYGIRGIHLCTAPEKCH